MRSTGQSKEDSVTLSKKARNNMYARVLEADALDTLLQVANERIVNLKFVISQTAVKDSAIKVAHQNELRIWQEKTLIYEEAIASLRKEIRKLRRQIVVMKITGGLIAGGAAYLLITK